MSATDYLKNESTTYESNTPKLNVPAMTDPILRNYDMHVNNFIRFLRDRLNIHLVYEGPDDIHQHILQKTTYTCSVYCKPKKILKNVFPIMIRSRLDMAIRHEGTRSFREPLPSQTTSRYPFQEVDIGLGFFIIGGFLRHMPYLYTSDPTNTHVIQRKLVRVYSYNAQDRGKELNFYVSDTKTQKCGDVVVVNNDGSKTNDDPRFFDHCPYPIHLTAYMNRLYRDGLFDIDHLGNKTVISPGHMFTKLFIKYLYGPLREQDWKLVKARTTLVCNSIENGCLLHVVSRKTVYHKEGKSAGKMTKNDGQESHREIGANGEIFMEKNIGCYREVPTQTYPFNPYLLYVIVRQLSNKINNSEVESFHPSYLHFLCILGIFETKNVGRTTMMVRDTIVSTCDDLDSVYHDAPDEKFWKALDLKPQENSPYYVVVNDACIPVSERCFSNLDLFRLKKTFGTIECYERGKFIVIRYKMGLIMKRLPHVHIWVTPYDELYWVRRLFGIEDVSDYDSSITSYLVDFNAFFKHTSFAKIILAFNAMKNGVLATDPRYTRWFMDTLSVYYHAPTSSHKVLLAPVDDGISKYFVLLLPHPVVTYMSCQGIPQEDCIGKRQKYDGFDCFRFFSLRIKLTASAWVKFHPVRGDSDSDLLGTLISGKDLMVEPFSIHVRLIKISPCEYRIYFSKPPFKIVQHYISDQMLVISLEQEHISNTGDKLCTLHGQKGVIRSMEKVPTLDGIEPDLIVNVYGMFRATPGQIIEAIRLGDGKDARRVCNSDGVEFKNASAFYGRTFYFSIVYWACEHLYAPAKCVLDRVTHQPVKGRSRGGGMRIGNMEVNALRANGISFCFEEKFFEDGDRVPDDNDPMQAKPKSVDLIVEDAKAYKFNVEFKHAPSVSMDEANFI